MSDISDAKSASTASFLSALVFNSAVFAVQIGVFTLLRPYFKSIYEPRTYVPPPEKRVKPLSRNPILWPYHLFTADYRAIISANGLDAYFFVRFLRVITYTFTPIWLVSWIILLPATAVNTYVEGLSGLDKFTFGNVARNRQLRYIAHIILVYGFTFWIFVVIRKEMRHFVVTRQQHLIEHTHAKSVQANTILVTGIPKRYLTQDALFKLFNGLPGGVKKIWINRNLKELPEIYDRRMKAASKLESAETQLLRKIAKLNQSKNHPAAKSSNDETIVDEVTLPADQRPTHKLGFLGLWGEKVDTIVWARKEIVECNKLLEEGRAKMSSQDERGPGEVDPEGSSDQEVFEDAALDEEGKPRLKSSIDIDPKKAGKQAIQAVGGVAKGAMKGAEAIKDRIKPTIAEGEYPTMNSAFIQFNRQIAAHLAVQVLAHHEPYRLGNRYIEVSPSDVIWSNLNLNPYEMKVRMAISYAATAALIIFWAIPVAFIGAVSNVYGLCARYSWLAWLCELPKPVVGILQGVLPPVLLAVLMMILPIILRLMARFEGIPKYTGLELSLMTRYFIFLVIHSFLIVTISSGVFAALRDLTSNPTSVPTTLAENLPKASTFFLTFILLQGLSVSAAGFLQIVRLVVYYVKLILLGSTPRSVWQIKYNLPSIAWGTLFPNTTLLVVITLGYSIISPIINGLAVMTFFLLYQLYKYLFLYVYQQPTTSDTGGLFYPKAIQHLFVGLYVQQICLCALFFLARDENNNASSVVQGALMIVLIIITAGFHAIINNSYGPLLTALPLSLQDRTYTQPHQPTHNDDADDEESVAEGKKRVAEPENVTELDGRRNVDDDDGAIEALAPATGSGSGSGSKSPPSPDQKAVQASEDAEEAYGFLHPAASRPQRSVWIPKDALGAYEAEERECREAGVSVGHERAEMNEKGEVDVNGGPPDLIGVVV